MAWTDYHIHTPLCRHAEGEPEQYLARAREIGLTEIGFSDHNPMPETYDDWRMLIEELPVYVEKIEALRKANPGFPIRLGLECDFIPGKEEWISELRGMADWDYFIGSVHYIAPGWDVDNPKYIGRLEGGSIDEIWGIYWERVGACVESRLFDFLAHPDLAKKFGHRPEGDLRRYYEPVVERLVAAGMPFEVNTAGLRKPVEELYPADPFLELAAEAGLRVLINSDAHHPTEVGMDFDQAKEALRRTGFSSLSRLAPGGAAEGWIQLPLD